MRSDDAKKFREEQRRSAQRDTKSQERRNQTRSSGRNTRRISSRDDNVIEFPGTVYKAPVGSAYRARDKAKKRKKPRLKLGALLLAASIGLGSIAVIGNIANLHNRDEGIQTISQLEETGIDLDDIGLEQDTLELMEKYDEYFENFDENSVLDMTDNDVIAMIREVRTLNFNAIKDKVAELRGVSRDDVKLWYSFDNNDGSFHTSVRINEDSYSDREIYTNNNGLIFGFGKENSIPKEISDLIIQTGEYDDLIEDLKADKITKRNAIRKLESLYLQISENVAVKDFTIDDKGNIELKDYDEQTKDQEQNKDDQER